MFSKFAASTLRLFLQRDNIGLLKNYSYKNEQKMVVLKRTGVCVWCGGLRLDKIGLLNLGEYWCGFYGSRKLVSPALLHIVA